MPDQARESEQRRRRRGLRGLWARHGAGRGRRRPSWRRTWPASRRHCSAPRSAARASTLVVFVPVQMRGGIFFSRALALFGLQWCVAHAWVLTRLSSSVSSQNATSAMLVVVVDASKAGYLVIWWQQRALKQPARDLHDGTCSRNVRCLPLPKQEVLKRLPEEQRAQAENARRIDALLQRSKPLGPAIASAQSLPINVAPVYSTGFTAAWLAQPCMRCAGTCCSRTCQHCHPAARDVQPRGCGLLRALHAAPARDVAPLLPPPSSTSTRTRAFSDCQLLLPAPAWVHP